MARIVLKEKERDSTVEIGDTVVFDYYPTPETKEPLPYEVMVVGKKTNEEGKTMYLLAGNHSWGIL